MHIETKSNDLSALLDRYNKEIDTLKAKLLNGVPWEELITVRTNITELAIAIHTSHNSEQDSNAVFSERSLAQVLE